MKADKLTAKELRAEKRKLRKKKRKATRLGIKRNWQLYVFLAPLVNYFFIFHYIPMYGVQIAFKEYYAMHHEEFSAVHGYNLSISNVFLVLITLEGYLRIRSSLMCMD